jgi:two-component system cell cycle response regulator DivK
MYRALVIEDNTENRELATVLLETAGHIVLTAETAEKGIEIARREKPDLILMDIHLPGMDGLQATAILKREAITKHIPVIAVTAMAMKGDEDRIRAAGCDGYISKPLHYKDLYKLMESLMEKNQQQRRNL